MGLLVGHLLESVAGICAVLAAAEPEQLAHFDQLRKLPVNHRCRPDEAIDRLRIYGAHIDEGFALLTDADLSRCLPRFLSRRASRFSRSCLALGST